MMEFAIIVVAIIVAEVVTTAAVLGLVFNKRIIKWYTKKAYKMTKTMEDEMEKLIDEED